MNQEPINEDGPLEEEDDEAIAALAPQEIGAVINPGQPDGNQTFQEFLLQLARNGSDKTYSLKRKYRDMLEPFGEGPSDSEERNAEGPFSDEEEENEEEENGEEEDEEEEDDEANGSGQEEENASPVRFPAASP